MPDAAAGVNSTANSGTDYNPRPCLKLLKVLHRCRSPCRHHSASTFLRAFALSPGEVQATDALPPPTVSAHFHAPSPHSMLRMTSWTCLVPQAPRWARPMTLQSLSCLGPTTPSLAIAATSTIRSCYSHISL